ncbi:replication initiation factor domain-containing protein [Aerolutibacter daejeonensis]|uniref:replication initiation factor domain-containing protein n=1 Tax=Aerolutibacter daejeonensis TaxID=346181 RepID=UPI00068F4929|nr:replication initiation factor domain-containing protein [Lysobacter daejeonensis]
MENSRTAETRTWAGLDWVSGSVDLWDLLREVGWGGTVRNILGDEQPRMGFDDLAAHLRGFGPRPKSDADANGELVVGKRAQFIPPDATCLDIAHRAFSYLFADSGLVLAADAAGGAFYAFRWMVTNVWGEPAGMIELGGCMAERKGGRPSLRFELTGLGCSIVEQRGNASADHAEPWCALSAKLTRVGGLLTRVDIAFDDFDGHRNLAMARCMYEIGEFDYRFGGELHRPKYQAFEKSHGGGSSFYVGHSSSERQLRVYEKGKKAGDQESPWVRWEVQMRSSKRRRIALDVLTDPIAYMRGAFAALDFVSSCLQRLAVANEVSKATLKSVRRHVKRQYGTTVYALMQMAPDRESFCDLIETFGRDGVPRWMKAGRLTWADVAGTSQCPDSTEENGNGT